jgi:hypothetical protein
VQSSVLPYVALPTYNGLRSNAMALLDLQRTLNGRVIFQESTSSLLAQSFNALLCDAMNRRDEGITHFLLMHADISPVEGGWIQTMIDEMERTGADVLSAIVPLKDTRGVTSTALDTDLWTPRRYTMHEIMALPETFTADNLLVNSGLMLVRFQGDWLEDVHFQMRDAILKDEDGKYRAVCESEDWSMSRQLHRLGRKVFATRKIKLHHEGGSQPFPNYSAWGTEKVDSQNMSVQAATLGDTSELP